MHAVISFSKLGIKHAEDEKIVHFLENIHTSGQRLLKLINDLLDLSKLESRKMEPVFSHEDIVNITHGVLEELGSLLKDKKIKVQFNPTKPIYANLDKSLITQVIVNLFSNAIKFSSALDNIEVYLGNVSNLSLDADYGSTYIKFSIIDQGIGIPKDEIDHVFESFVQSSKNRSNGGGTGLGLPISKEIIELHHGKIWAESPPENKDTGTVFTFIIPTEQNNQDMN
jgi:signal transduction histidine kinase